MAKAKLLKLIALVAIGLFLLAPVGMVLAQEEEAAEGAEAEEAAAAEAEAEGAEGAEDAEAAEDAEEAAPEELPVEEAEGEAGSVQDYFAKGGPVMYPLLLTSVLAGAYIIERLFTYQFAKINARKFTDEVVSLVKAGKRTEAIEKCKEYRGPIAAVFRAVLQRADRGVAAAEKTAANAGAVELAFLERGLIVLASVSTIAPILGFLGTVTGMIRAFEGIARAGEVKPTVVASGISEALITTATGLAIAFPVLIMYNYFTSRIDRFVLEMEESTTELIDAIEDTQA
ncbi:MAG: MotA/TolQ/ExbB proton channel family protein [Candidatus Coatesbacteria bacterium]|nr:MotA/TolQ/ExbB proton channel family protein [Candidatus Coatesbacteria bacterium]